MIRLVADVLVRATRPQDVVGRVGGDEFVVVLEHDEPAPDLDTIIDRIRGSLAANGCSASIGSAGTDLVPANTSFEQLLHLADVDMYANKMRNRSSAA